MSYVCPEKDCEYQKAKPGKCPHHDKELVKCEIKTHCSKCGQPVDVEKLKVDNKQIVIRKAKNEEVGKDVVCPVMNKKFTVSKKTKVVEYKDKTYYLCCAGCEKAILKNPGKYISVCPKCGEQVNPEDLKLKPAK